VIDSLGLPAAADPQRAVPEHPGARLDRIETALRVLGEEELRLERLGLDRPRARCREARRFWGFVGGLYAMAEQDAATLGPSGDRE